MNLPELELLPEYLCRKKSNICDEVGTGALTALFKLDIFLLPLVHNESCNLFVRCCMIGCGWKVFRYKYAESTK